MQRGAKHEEEANTMAKGYLQDTSTNKCIEGKEINPDKRQEEETEW